MFALCLLSWKFLKYNKMQQDVELHVSESSVHMCVFLSYSLNPD